MAMPDCSPCWMEKGMVEADYLRVATPETLPPASVRRHRGEARWSPGGGTSRDVVINDVALSSLKTPEWSQLVFCDVFVTILVWSLWWRHICSSVTKLVFSS
jgi:hypothetical protein